jgi:hypothetical protein
LSILIDIQKGLLITSNNCSSFLTSVREASPLVAYITVFQNNSFVQQIYVRKSSLKKFICIFIYTKDETVYCVHGLVRTYTVMNSPDFRPIETDENINSVNTYRDVEVS